MRGVCARLGHWRRSQPDMYHSAYVADCLPRLLAPYVRQQVGLRLFILAPTHIQDTARVPHELAVAILRIASTMEVYAIEVFLIREQICFMYVVITIVLFLDPSCFRPSI